jgi:hypothetical protein
MAPKAAPTHPPYAVLIKEAIASLKVRMCPCFACILPPCSVQILKSLGNLILGVHVVLQDALILRRAVLCQKLTLLCTS